MTVCPHIDDTDGTPAKERPALFRALEESPVEVPMLIQAGADVNQRYGDDDSTPLLRAVEMLANGYVQEDSALSALRAAIGTLLDAGADVNAADRQGYTALALAASCGPSFPDRMPTIIIGLLERGADPNQLDENGTAPLDHACEAANGEIVRVMWEAGARPARIVNGASPTLRQAVDMSLAALRGDSAAVDRLLERGVDINSRDEDGRTALHAAARSGNAPMVAHLLERGADIHAREDFLAQSSGKDSEGRGDDGAYWMQHPDWDGGIVVYPRQGYQPLHGAAEEGHSQVIRLLLSCGADVYALSGPLSAKENLSGNRVGTPLERAAAGTDWSPLRNEAMECVLVVLEAGYPKDAALSDAERERRRSDLARALRHAAYHGTPELVHLLLSYGAGERREDLLAAMRLACLDFRFSKLRTLWEAGQQFVPPVTLMEFLDRLAELRRYDEWCMHCSLLELCRECPEIDVNTPDPASGETPLLWAIRNLGASFEFPWADMPDIYQNEDFPEFWAQRFENSVIAKILKHGADPNMRNHTGESALSLARAKGYQRLTERLAHRADSLRSDTTL